MERLTPHSTRTQVQAPDPVNFLRRLQLNKFLFKLFGVLKFLVPALYMAGAVFIWVVFSRTNPDGLANIWIGIYTFPIFIIGTFLLHQQFPYMPGGYYQAHALYFWPSVILLAVAMILIFHGLQKFVQSLAQRESGTPIGPLNSNVSTMKIIRWLLIVPAALLGWYIGLLAGLVIYQINKWSCPSEYILSGACLAPWSSYVEKFAGALAAITAASLIVLLPTLAAPSNRRVVANAAYLVGLVAVAYFLTLNISGFWLPATLAALAGGITLWRIRSVLTSG